uniref:Uncharacterized protein n=1 Tax=Hyaloperonospora arabidopsidis (strain Emoy2) TaxID=559515 RepID=M4BQN5_HYAAE
MPVLSVHGLFRGRTQIPQNAQESPRDSFGRVPESDTGTATSQCHDEPIEARRGGLYVPGRSPQGRTQTALGHPTNRHGEIEKSTPNRDVDSVPIPHPRASRRGCGNAQKLRTLSPPTESGPVCPPPLHPLEDSYGCQRFLRGAYFDPPCREGDSERDISFAGAVIRHHTTAGSLAPS